MRRSVILDTDIGYDADDLFALVLLLKSPELKVDLIITGDEVAGKRALFAKKVLELMGRDVPVVRGAELGPTGFVVDELLEGYTAEIDADYITAIKRVVDESEEVIYIGIQAFTNLARYLERFPEDKPKLRIFQMGSAVPDYSRGEGWVEHNIKIDISSARQVIAFGTNISLVMAQTTFNPAFRMGPECKTFQRLRTSKNPVHKMLVRHCELFHEHHAKFGRDLWPLMHDPLTVSVALGKDFVQFEEANISMDEKGTLHYDPHGKSVRLSKAESKDKEFMMFLEERIFST